MNFDKHTLDSHMKGTFLQNLLVIVLEYDE